MVIKKIKGIQDSKEYHYDLLKSSARSYKSSYSLKNWEAALSVIMKVLFQWAVSRHGTASDFSLTKNQERERVNILNVLFVKYTNKKTLQWEGRAIFLRWVATVSGSIIFLISINNYDWPPFPSNLSVPIDSIDFSFQHRPWGSFIYSLSCWFPLLLKLQTFINLSICPSCTGPRLPETSILSVMWRV